MSFFPKKEAVDRDGNPITNIHCMVDLETMGTRHYSPILTIGAVLFDPTRQDSVDYLMARSFLRVIDVEDAMKHSNGVDGGTLRWWMTQKAEAFQALIQDEVAVGLKQALKDLHAYCKDRGTWVNRTFYDGLANEPQACMLWAKGPDFDGKLLEDAYERVGEHAPFRFYSYRCVRTIQDLAWPAGPDDRPLFDTGVKHDARADAVAQAMTVQAAFVKLGLSSSDVTMDHGGQR